MKSNKQRRAIVVVRDICDIHLQALEGVEDAIVNDGDVSNETIGEAIDQVVDGVGGETGDAVDGLDLPVKPRTTVRVPMRVMGG